MKIFYEKLLSPDDKFNSCLEGRIYSCYKYFLDGKNVDEEFYLFLCRCCLKYHPIETEQITEAWYFQPLSLWISDNYDISSEWGFKELSCFLNNYGIECRWVKYETKTDMMQDLIERFQKGEIPIALIDQFEYIKSKKYQKQKELIHALLLGGIETEIEKLLIVDSGKQIVPISFEIFQMASINEIVYCKYEHKQSEMKESAFEMNSMEMEVKSIEARRKFLERIEEGALENKENSRILFEGCVATIQYKIIPYIKKTCIWTLRKGDVKSNEYANQLLKAWENFALILLKVGISQQKEGTISDRMRFLKEKELLYEKYYIKGEKR